LIRNGTTESWFCAVGFERLKKAEGFEVAKRDKRSKKRVALDHQIESTAIAIDGTWSIKGRVDDISETGAKLSTIGKVDDRIRRDEFFLVLTNDGKVNRRCKIAWENDGAFGLQFVSSRRVGRLPGAS
jgi:hypothetical protein